MKLIIGLGNPGEKYDNTRHNVGFMVADKLALMINSQWSMVKKFNSLVINHQPSAIYSKPQTFMNTSGESVAKLVNYYKINLSDLWVIHDDLDIILGQYKIQLGVGPKVHFGINSIEEKLGAKDFWRVRVGIDNRGSKGANKYQLSINTDVQSGSKVAGEEYVLQKFREDEKEIVEGVIDKIIREL